MDRRLALYVVLPLVVVFLLLSAIAWPVDPQDLAFGVAIEIVGILVTVLYVNWVLQAHEKGRWAATDELILHEIRNSSFQTLTVFGHLMELYELIFPNVEGHN